MSAASKSKEASMKHNAKRARRSSKPDGGRAQAKGRSRRKPRGDANQPQAKKSSGRADSKQAQVIALLRRPGGATLDAIVAATGWQRHTARGVIAGALKKKLGLDVISEKTEQGRVYRINDGTAKRTA
jgi:hypothetical protein